MRPHPLHRLHHQRRHLLSLRQRRSSTSDGVSLGMMWSLRRHLQQASELATAHYPETLHTIAVVNAPSFFPTVWSWIKVRLPTFPPPFVTESRISPCGLFKYRLGSMRARATRSTYWVLILALSSFSTWMPIRSRKSTAVGYRSDSRTSPYSTPLRVSLLGSDEIPHGPLVFVDGKVVRPEGHPSHDTHWECRDKYLTLT
jgi:hypothetical protein